MTEETLNDIQLVYLGERPGKTGLVSLVITPERLNEAVAEWDMEPRSPKAFALNITEHVDNAASAFTIKKNKPNVVGGTYSAKGILEGNRVVSLVTSGLKYASRPNHRLESLWQATSTAAKMEASAASQLKKLSSNGRLDHLLKELGEVYRNISPGSRQSFKLMVLKALEGGKKL